MAETIGIGVIGMGWMGQVHSRAYRLIPDRFADMEIQPRLVICSDNVESRARESRQRFGFEQSTTDWHEVISNPSVDVVNIAAPNGLHLEMVRESAKAGKHIMCEKPVGKNPTETAGCEKAARDAGVRTFVGYNYRWPPLVQYTRELIETGRLGRLSYFHGRFFTCYAADPLGVLSWRFQSEHGLGVLGDLMSHTIDMAHLMAGPIEKTVSDRTTYITQRPVASAGEGTHFSVAADPGAPGGEVTNEDFASALVQFENGTRGNLEVSRVFPGPKCEMAFELIGTEGAVRWNFERLNEIEIQYCSAKDEEDGYATVFGGPAHPYHSHFNPGPAISIGYEDLKVIEAAEFLKSIKEGKQSAPGFEDALAVANVQSAMIRSWETGGWEDVTSTRLE